MGRRAQAVLPRIRWREHGAEHVLEARLARKKGVAGDEKGALCASGGFA